jgi:flagellar hook-basal body complex protein FliE
MQDPLNINGLQPGQPVGPLKDLNKAANPAQGADGESFKNVLLDSLNEVNRLQKEAADGVEKLMTGQTDNMAEVFSTVKKSEVAFSMLMEMRNKLVEAYREIQQMRV